MSAPSFDVLAWYKLNRASAVGIDEAGRGPLAGPVVAAAVILDPKKPIRGLKDSKVLTAKKREKLYDLILARAKAVAVAEVDSEQIDRLNIFRASLKAHSDAFAKLRLDFTQEPSGVLVDGNALPMLPLGISAYAVVGGDGIIPAIMAASIVAKVWRDRLMVEAAKLYPAYGFEGHKGYATAAHLEALAKHGPCPIHRRSFAPVVQPLLNFEPPAHEVLEVKPGE
jgi:ribonuclease HII